MIADRRARLAGALALCAAFAGSLAAKDVYRGFLDPAIPQHRATLDLLARLEKTPDDASLHNDLACLIARDGFWRDALREFDIAAKLDKADGRPLYNAGLVQATRGEWGSAARAFRKAVSRTPGNWSAWWMLGFAEERGGNVSAAVAAYKTSLRVDTSLFDVRRNPFAAQTRLKGRVLLESYEGRMNRLTLPVLEQLAQPDLVTSFQQGRVSVSAVAGAPVPADMAVPADMPVPAGVRQAPAGVQAPEESAVRPASAGPVVTSVPPVSASRPASSPGSATFAPTAAPFTRANEPIPPDFPTQSPAGSAPPRRRVLPGPGGGGGGDAPAEPTPTPTPPPG